MADKPRFYVKCNTLVEINEYCPTCEMILFEG